MYHRVQGNKSSLVLVPSQHSDTSVYRNKPRLYLRQIRRIIVDFLPNPGERGDEEQHPDLNLRLPNDVNDGTQEVIQDDPTFGCCSTHPNTPLRVMERTRIKFEYQGGPQLSNKMLDAVK